MAAQWKERGNQEFSQGNYEKAVEYFTNAISADPNDHVFYSNRSACYSSLKNYEKALEDADKCIQLKPDWVRGYTRKALAEFYLEEYEKAIQTYEAGLKLDPNNQQLKDGLEQARSKQKEASNPMAGLFSEANIEKLRSHPKTAHYFLQQDFVTMLQLIKTNPNLMQMMFQDPRFSDCLSVLIGFDVNSAPSSHPEPKPDPKSESRPEPSPEYKHEPKFQPKEESKLDQSEEYKELGNQAYKNKEWDKALEFYDKALELKPEEVTYINNKAAVYFAMKDYQKCVEVCDEAVAKAKEVRADLSKIGRALSRKGLALQQIGDLDGAIKSIKASLMEYKDDKLKFTLRDLEKLKKKKDEEAYLSPEKAEEANNVANDYFKQGNFGAALSSYDEAVKRNPKGAKYYSNRAACYIKVMEFSRALTDINKALELEPNFVRALVRKGNIHYLLKEYHKSLESYQSALKLEPENNEAKEGYQKTLAAVNSNNSQPDEERIRHAMADPEIQSIMRDPTIQQVLKDLQENPSASQGYFKDPKIMNAISKLAAAGILRLG
jgi:stress-induced-phosphoprotein 1